jgi:hypothetical protein
VLEECSFSRRDEAAACRFRAGDLARQPLADSGQERRNVRSGHGAAFAALVETPDSVLVSEPLDGPPVHGPQVNAVGPNWP